jgi:hypothetical protein
MKTSQTLSRIFGPITLMTIIGCCAFSATAQTATGVIEVCKISSATNPISAGTPFTFTVSPTPTNPSGSIVVPTGAASTGPICSGALTVTAGTVLVKDDSEQYRISKRDGISHRPEHRQ